MTGKSGFRSWFDRAVAEWNNFFFKPRDPSTLCLMRVMTGIFVLYLHVAYTWDLYNFFGPHGFANLDMVNEVRHDYAIAAPEIAWGGAQRNINIPVNHEVREAFFDWAKSLPEHASDRKNALEYLNTLPDSFEDAGQALAFAEQLLIHSRDDAVANNKDEFRKTTDEERQKMLDYLMRDDVKSAPLDVLPMYVRQLPVEKRDTIRRNVLKFVATFAGRSPADVAMIFGHLLYHATIPIAVHNPNEPVTELQRTYRFLTEQNDPARHDTSGGGPYMPDDAKERAHVFAYLNRWDVDPRVTYAKGMYTWSVWFHVTDPVAMGVIHAMFLVVMAMFALGLFTRITAVITWIAALSYIHRTSYVLFGMDTMMNLCLIYMVLAPSGATISLDRWFEKRRARRDLEQAKKENRDTREFEAILAGPRPSIMANFVTRLLQIHFCFIYEASGLSKLKGPAWWNHTAMWATVMNPEFSPTVFKPYMWLMRSTVSYRWLIEIMMSFGAIYTLFLEIGFPFLVWRPRLRPYMIMLAIGLHTGIAVMMGLTIFGLLMMTLLMCYIPPQTVKQWLELGEQRFRGPAEPATAPALKAAVAKV